MFRCGGRWLRHIATSPQAMQRSPAQAALSLQFNAAASLHSPAAQSTPSKGQPLPSLAAWASAFLAGAAGLSASFFLPGTVASCETAEAQTREFTAEEVAGHNRPETGIWVTYKGGVYDITEFVETHPGGAAKIMLAAGGAIDPYWAMYQQHNQAEVHKMLAQYKIGTLKGWTQQQAPPDPYVHEPSRLPALLVRSAKPFNAETPLEVLSENMITSNELFYVRNHLPVPEVDEKNYTLTIEGEGLRTLTLTLQDLKSQFRRHSVVATLQCAGNRREELNSVKEVKGLTWDVGAISTAVWSGARLREVLMDAGLSGDDTEVEHVQFEGMDKDSTDSHYGASIPVSKALDPAGDVILAYEMNGKPLPLDHGFPVRVIVPGVTGARNVKWLSKVVASKHESDSFWQQRDYKSFSPSTDWDSVDWSSAPAIQQMPVTSAICEPKAGALVDEYTDSVTVRGYAWSGGGNGIVRVDVSADAGKSWMQAKLKTLEQKSGRHWAWTLWEAEVPLPKNGAQLTLLCKATDESYNTQPDSLAGVWNLRGVNNNAWHRVPLKRES